MARSSFNTVFISMSLVLLLLVSFCGTSVDATGAAAPVSMEESVHGYYTAGDQHEVETMQQHYTVPRPLGNRAPPSKKGILRALPRHRDVIGRMAMEWPESHPARAFPDQIRVPSEPLPQRGMYHAKIVDDPEQAHFPAKMRAGNEPPPKIPTKMSVPSEPLPPPGMYHAEIIDNPEQVHFPAKMSAGNEPPAPPKTQNARIGFSRPPPSGERMA